ncbi:MAG: hypothetical protein AAF193_06190, partial [Bacteroidota bacterium]
DFQEALDLEHQAAALNDSLRIQARTQQQSSQRLLDEAIVSRFAQALEIQKLKQEAIKKENRLKTVVFIVILAFLVLLITAIIFRNKQRAKVIQAEKKYAEETAKSKALENQILNQEIKSQSKDLESLALDSNRMMDWLESLQCSFSDLKKELDEYPPQMKDIELSLKSQKSLLETNSVFIEKIEKLNFAFYAQLKDQFPNLTSYDHKLCAYVRLGMDSKQIASLLNITVDSVNRSRYRLRKKLELDSGVDLEHYLKSI